MHPALIRLVTIAFLLAMVGFSFLPVPGTTLIMLYVVIFRPRWFKRVVDSIYEETGRSASPDKSRQP